jgi:hypothetical protein
MAKTSSKSQKRTPSGKNKPDRKGKKKLGSAKGPGKSDPLRGKPFESRAARSKARKRVVDPLPGDPFEL